MKTTALSVILLFCVSFVASAQITTSDWVGKTQTSKAMEELLWFSEGFDAYTPDSATVANLKNEVASYTFIAFGGTWCGDTKFLLPQFFKTIAASGVPEENVLLYFLDTRMKSPEKLERSYKIKSIPTFIVLKDGKEVGRIVESVQTPIEKELYTLMKK